jgi:hypothetical protein
MTIAACDRSFQNILLWDFRWSLDALLEEGTGSSYPGISSLVPI